MLEFLGTGERRQPVAGAANGAVPGSLEGQQNLTATEDFESVVDDVDPNFSQGGPTFTVTGDFQVTGEGGYGAGASDRFVDDTTQCISR